MKKTCEYCHKDFKTISKNQRFCSGSCGARARHQKTINRICQVCGDSFKATNANARYCEKEYSKECLECGKTFEHNPSRPKDYCSRECAMKNKQHHKICKRCGKEFTTTNKNKEYCEGPHYSKCETCGKQILEKQAKRVTRFCSTSCSSKFKRYTCVCELCGKEFASSEKDSRFCKDAHTTNCVICNKEITIFNNRKVPKTCSQKCSAKITDYSARNAKSKETLKNTYGVDYVSQIQEVKNKKVSTSQDKYGKDNPSQVKEFQEKRTQTNLDRYGVENGGGAPEVQERIKKTNLERYGVEYALQSKEVKDKILKNLQEKYGEGITNYSQVPEIRAKADTTRLKKFGVKSTLSLPEVQEKTKGKRISNINRKWQKDLKNLLNVDFDLEKTFATVDDKKNLYADLAFENIFIDINPVITHNSSISFIHKTKRCTIENCDKESHLPMPQNYHQARMLAAEANGNLLLQYFDWYDKDIFLSIVRSKLHLDENKVFAKQCVVKQITQRDANTFLKKNHLLGAAKGQTFCVGLFYDNELVHVHTYGPARLNKKYEWEAIRSASKQNWHVQGGFSKCDKFFFKTAKPSSVISYVDLAISTGETELANPGWKLLGTNKPNATWIRLTSDESLPKFVKDASVRKLSADKLLGMEVGSKYPSHHDDGSVFSNDEVLELEGYVKQFDAGTRTFVWC